MKCWYRKEVAHYNFTLQNFIWFDTFMTFVNIFFAWCCEKEYYVSFLKTSLYHWQSWFGHVQNSVYSFGPFVDIDSPTNFVVSSLSMLFSPKYIYCSRITWVIDLLIFESPIMKKVLGQRHWNLFHRNFKMLLQHVWS